eukprot:2809889-Rhodomonas_salina.2
MSACRRACLLDPSSCPPSSPVCLSLVSLSCFRFYSTAAPTSSLGVYPLRAHMPSHDIKLVQLARCQVNGDASSCAGRVAKPELVRFQISE